MKPWHLIPEAVRDEVTAHLDNVNCCRCIAPDPTDHHECMQRSEALAVAAQALRDAAPYPDEALMVNNLDGDDSRDYRYRRRLRCALP